jgi:hypothetical protein
MPMTGKVVSKGWKKDGEGRQYLEAHIYPTTSEPQLSSTKKSKVKAYDSIALENGDKLTATLITPLER